MHSFIFDEDSNANTLSINITLYYQLKRLFLTTTSIVNNYVLSDDQ